MDEQVKSVYVYMLSGIRRQYGFFWKHELKYLYKYKTKDLDMKCAIFDREAFKAAQERSKYGLLREENIYSNVTPINT